MRNQEKEQLPTLEALQAERERLRHRRRYRRALLGTVSVLAVVAALAVLISTFFMPVFRITGSSMEPNLNDGRHHRGHENRALRARTGMRLLLQ